MSQGKIEAKMVTCGTSEAEHNNLDNCWSCAPYWWIIPVCPTHNWKLKESGWCKKCKKYYKMPDKK